MRFSSRKGGYNKEAGYTLIEVLVGVSILAVGLLAVARMQITAIQGIDKSDEASIALNLAQREMERIIDMDYSDSRLNDTPGNNGDLYSTASTDYQDCVDSYGDTVVPGGNCLDELNAYNLIYNIKNNATGAPPTPYKEVVLIVQWQRKGKTYTRTLTFVKSLAS
jgi:type IV pilus assembly protein PilV